MLSIGLKGGVKCWTERGHRVLGLRGASSIGLRGSIEYGTERGRRVLD